MAFIQTRDPVTNEVILIAPICEQNPGRMLTEYQKQEQGEFYNEYQEQQRRKFTALSMLSKMLNDIKTNDLQDCQELTEILQPGFRNAMDSAPAFEIFEEHETKLFNAEQVMAKLLIRKMRQKAAIDFPGFQDLIDNAIDRLRQQSEDPPKQ